MSVWTWKKVVIAVVNYVVEIMHRQLFVRAAVYSTSQQCETVWTAKKKEEL